MKLTVVGCSGSFPSAESACSSYLVEADGFRLLLDMGNGALGELQRHCGLYDLDAIFLSHLHADHCIDMCAYFVARYYRHDGGRCAPLPVYGPEGTEHRLTTAYADTPSASSMSEVFDFHTVKPSTFEVGPFTVHTERVAHPVEAYAVRVEHGGRSLTYSGDTGATPCWTNSPATPTCSCARPPSRTARRTSPTCTSTDARRARAPPGPAPGAWCSPTSPVDRPRGQPGRRARGVRRDGGGRRRGRGVRDLSPRHRRHPRHGSAKAPEPSRFRGLRHAVRPGLTPW